MAPRRIIPMHPGGAAFLGAIAIGVPGWILTAVLQPILHPGREPDGFNGLDDAGELIAGTLAGALIGAVGLFGAAAVRARPRPCRQEALAVAFYATVLMVPAMIPGIVLTVLTGGAPVAVLVAVPPALHLSWAIGRTPIS